MTKKRRSSAQQRSLIGTLIAAIIIVVALIISNLTGVDLLGISPTPTPIPPTEVAGLPGNVTAIPVGQGLGAAKGFWQVYFTAPTGSRDPADYRDGIDAQLAAAINGVQRTLDIAAFEFNNPVLTQAVLEAHRRGIQVRIVTDDEHGLNDEDSTIGQFLDAGIPVVADQRSGLMHNKFMILDGSVVWTGSWNYTINGTYRNNNNALALRSQRAVESYQIEFNEMFERREFGQRASANNGVSYVQDGISIQIVFAPEDNVVPAIIQTLNEANSHIRFMAFSFTLDEIEDVLLAKAEAGIAVEGIFETTGSETRFSALTPLFCAGLDVRQDGNPFILHHKVFIVDDDTVLTGSFNFSASATGSNDENMVIIHDPDLAAQYIAEFERRWAEAVVPDDLTC